MMTTSPSIDVLLDTNVVIAVIGKRAVSSINRLRSEVARGTRILVPAIVVHELRFGIAKSTRRTANEHALEAFLSSPLETPVFDTADASEAADIRAFLQRSGTPIGPSDVLIAAQARRRAAILVPGNVREFRRVPGLTVQDWAAE